MPRIDFPLPSLETLHYVQRKLLRLGRSLELPPIGPRQRRLLEQRRGPRLRPRLRECLQRLPQGDLEPFAAAAAAGWQEVLDRDEELARVVASARMLALQAEDGALLCGVEAGVLADRVMEHVWDLLSKPAQGARQGDLQELFRHPFQVRWTLRRKDKPAARPGRAFLRRRRSKHQPGGERTPWQEPLQRCLAVPLPLLGILPERLQRLGRRTGVPLLTQQQRDRLVLRGPHGREALVTALMPALEAAPQIGRETGVSAAALKELLRRQSAFAKVRRQALLLAEQAYGSLLLLGAFGRSVYDVLVEVLTARLGRGVPSQEQRRLRAAFAPLLALRYQEPPGPEEDLWPSAGLEEATAT